MSALSEFEEFLLKEYENIAKAHFEAQKQFAVFFRYYILFASVPVLILTTADQHNKVFTSNIFAYVLLFLAFVGFFFYLFVINLKHEAVLYSRTVNGIRFHFYQNSPAHAPNIRVLPIDKTKPKYYNPINPVLIIMIILNTVFSCLGLYYDGNRSTLIFIIIGALIIALHIVSNYIQSNIQEKKYP
jgi:uncharacterized membrane-anchored protein YitT (DUF2179 family)